MLKLLLSLLFCCLVRLHCEDCHEISIPYLSFKSQNLTNNSYVVISEIGRVRDGSDSIQCHCELQNCCQTNGTLSASWSFPNGSELLSSNSGYSIFQSQGVLRADLHHNDNNSNMVITPAGLYCCRISYHSSDTSAKETLCIGIYGSSRG